MKSYDVIMVGSGLGSLVSALILAKHNYKVCVLEKNEQLGGALQIFKRDGITLDTGVHYIGGLAKGQNLHQFFKYLGIMDKLKLKELDRDGFDKISFASDEQVYALANSYEKLKANLLAVFPEEEPALDTYIDKMKSVCKALSLYNLEPPTAPDFYADYNTCSIYDFLKSITQNEKLIAVLLGNNLLYYADKEQTPIYVHALIVNSYIESAWRCVDGGQQIANLLVRALRNHGATVLRSHEVVKVNVENQVANSVTLVNGEVLHAKQFISNISAANSLNLLADGVLRGPYKKRMQSMPQSMSAFTMHLVLKPNTIKYFNHNHYHFTSDNIWCNSEYEATKWPENLLFFTPASSRNDIYAESFGVMCAMSFDEVRTWENTFHTLPENEIRDPAYLKWKSDKEQVLLAIVYAQYPMLKGNVEAYYSSSPLSYRDFLNTKDGSTYGTKKNCLKPVETYVSHRTKIENLYLTGQDINLHGILGVTISAFLTCSAFVDINQLMQEVREA